MTWRSRHAKPTRSRRRSQSPPPGLNVFQVDLALRKRLSDTAYDLYSSINDTYREEGRDPETEMMFHEVAAWMLHDGRIVATGVLDESGSQELTHAESAREILETAGVGPVPVDNNSIVTFMAKSGAIRLWLNCAWVDNGLAVDAYTVTPAQMSKLHHLYKEMPHFDDSPPSFVFEAHQIERQDRFDHTIWGEDWTAFRRALRKQNTLLEG